MNYVSLKIKTVNIFCVSSFSVVEFHFRGSHNTVPLHSEGARSQDTQQKAKIRGQQTVPQNNVLVFLVLFLF
jgi:hypothetical protein